MARQTQLFLDQSLKPRKQHGGDINKGHRKMARPIATKSPMHIVLRSHRARGVYNMLTATNRRRIEARLHEDAANNHVKILGFANVGNHLHITAQAKTRQGFIAFLRTFTGMVARICTGAKKGKAKGQFWEKLAFTRIISWGKDKRVMDRYIHINAQESRLGHWARDIIHTELKAMEAKANAWTRAMQSQGKVYEINAQGVKRLT
jgi:REP element-mobilizing transposase RayT